MKLLTHKAPTAAPVALTKRAAPMATPVVLLLIGFLAFSVGSCLEPAERSDLQLVIRGPVYPRPRCAKGPAALGKLHPLGDPVPGAAITLTPGDYQGTTGADGRLLLSDLPTGTYRIRVAAPSFAPLEDQTVKVLSGGTKLALNLDPCVFGGGHKTRMGFGNKVTLIGTSFCGGEWDKAAYTWTQLEGPDLRNSITGWNSQVLTLTTKKIEEVRELPDQPQILSFSPDQAGEYVFQVVATTKDGRASRDYVLVTSTNVTGGMNSVPPYDDFFVVGEKKGPWSWVIDKWPEGWPKTLQGADTRTPSVRILPNMTLTSQETLVIRDEVSGLAFSFVVGDWDMVNRDCGREGCHPPLQRSWEGTRHANTWRRLLDGELVSERAQAAESCATCHSLGYDRTTIAKNGGYDDIADLYGVTFPSTLAKGNYDKVPQPLKEVSNVYCVACHGPARVDPPVAEQPGRFESGVCARCHDRLPEQDLVAQWRRSRMSQTIKGDLNGPEARSECAKCHTAQGHYYGNFALGRPPNQGVVVMSCCENLAPITCQACHSPMYARNKAQVFAHGSVTTSSGLSLQKVGTGAGCIMCHNTDHDVAAAGTLAQRLAPHSPQAGISYGRAGYLLGPQSYPVPSGATCSKNAGDACATCHMDEGPPPGDPDHRKVGDHTFRMISVDGRPNTRPCQACHAGRESFDPAARHDYDGDGKTESVRDEVDSLMALLRSRLAETIAAREYKGCDTKRSPAVFFKKGFAERIVLTDAMGFDLGDCDRNGVVERQESPFVFPDTDLSLHKAAYNYMLVEADKSRGLHNLPFVVSLLQRTIHAVTDGKNLPDWDLFEPAKP